MSLINEAGNTYGYLTVIERAPNSNAKQVMWMCKCECGKEKAVLGTSLRKKLTSSCGCKKGTLCKEANLTHGVSNHPLYKVQRSMLNRCGNADNIQYHRYGGRGIYVCKEWEDVKVFIDWAKDNGWRKGLQIDRIDNDKGYYPENCRFVTSKENIHNRNTIISTNTSGYTGVSFYTSINKFVARLVEGKGYSSITIALGCYNTPEEAAAARDRYIIENNLPHKLQILGE